MAPVDAALADGQIFSFDALVQHLRDLPTQGVQWRLVEGAGGLAVPLESNHAATPLSSTTPQAENTPRDWSDFACAVGADACVLVVADRLGAINQARLLAAYAVQKQVANCGLWLNAANADTPPAIRASNADALHDGASGVPLLAIHNHNELWPQAANLPWLR